MEIDKHREQWDISCSIGTGALVSEQ